MAATQYQRSDPEATGQCRFILGVDSAGTALAATHRWTSFICDVRGQIAHGLRSRGRVAWWRGCYFMQVSILELMQGGSRESYLH